MGGGDKKDNKSKDSSLIDKLLVNPDGGDGGKDGDSQNKDEDGGDGIIMIRDDSEARSQSSMITTTLDP